MLSPPEDTQQLSETDEVDEVVVDRSWSEDFESESNSDAPGTASSRHDATVADADSSGARPTGVWALPLLAFVRTRIWPTVREFYAPRFAEAEEHLFQREVWGQGKRSALWASVFFIANFILAVTSIQDPVVLADKVREDSFVASCFLTFV